MPSRLLFCSTPRRLLHLGVSQSPLPNTVIFMLSRSYLAEEFLAKKGVECSFDYYTMRGYYPIAPQQTNFHDCGIFLLEYAKEFLRNPPAPDDVGASSRFTKMFDPDHIMEEGRWEVAEVSVGTSEQCRNIALYLSV